MKKFNADLVKELISLNRNVVRDLRTRGYVPPTKTKDGKVKVGSYLIEKDLNGFYSIKDNEGSIINQNINLPQSAAILANNLALGMRTEKDKILILDTYYGHYYFDELNCQKLYRKYSLQNSGRAEILLEKLQTARLKKKFFLNKIIEGFDNLLRIV